MADFSARLLISRLHLVDRETVISSLLKHDTRGELCVHVFDVIKAPQELHHLMVVLRHAGMRLGDEDEGLELCASLFTSLLNDIADIKRESEQVEPSRTARNEERVADRHGSAESIRLSAADINHHILVLLIQFRNAGQDLTAIRDDLSPQLRRNEVLFPRLNREIGGTLHVRVNQADFRFFLHQQVKRYLQSGRGFPRSALSGCNRNDHSSPQKNVFYDLCCRCQFLIDANSIY